MVEHYIWVRVAGSNLVFLTIKIDTRTLFESNKLLTEMLVFLLYKNVGESDNNINNRNKQLLDMICKFSNVKYTLKNGVIKDIEKSNIFFKKTHILTCF